MSDKYRVSFQSTSDPFDNGLVNFREFDTAADAEAYCANHADMWQGMYTFTVVPPYAPPAITHEGDLETTAGSPLPCGDDDLLGIKPGC